MDEVQVLHHESEFDNAFNVIVDCEYTGSEVYIQSYTLQVELNYTTAN